jgi:hypothetical protein
MLQTAVTCPRSDATGHVALQGTATLRRPSCGRAVSPCQSPPPSTLTPSAAATVTSWAASASARPFTLCCRFALSRYRCGRRFDLRRGGILRRPLHHPCQRCERPAQRGERPLSFGCRPPRRAERATDQCLFGGVTEPIGLSRGNSRPWSSCAGARCGHSGRAPQGFGRPQDHPGKESP